jgi:hypothetical protein
VFINTPKQQKYTPVKDYNITTHRRRVEGNHRELLSVPRYVKQEEGRTKSLKTYRFMISVIN